VKMLDARIRFITADIAIAQAHYRLSQHNAPTMSENPKCLPTLKQDHVTDGMRLRCDMGGEGLLILTVVVA
jgi:hypothetical protein